MKRPSQLNSSPETTIVVVAGKRAPFGSFGGGPDSVNLGSLNVHLDVPVVNKAGRGMPFTYTLSYDSSVYYPNAATWTPVTNWGWRGVTEVETGYLDYKETSIQCDQNFDRYWTYTNFVYLADARDFRVTFPPAPRRTWFITSCQDSRPLVCTRTAARSPSATGTTAAAGAWSARRAR